MNTKLSGYRYMPKLRTSLTVLMAAVMLCGCATLSKEECMTGNWEAIGFSDGAAGRSAERLNSHNRACAKVGISPDYHAWERGRQAGLKQYCTTDNAYQTGKQGYTLNAVCPADITANLQRINADGRAYHLAQTQLQQTQRDLEQHQQQYRKLRDGDNLDFKSEKEARAYLLSLPDTIRKERQHITDMQQRISDLQRKYGY